MHDFQNIFLKILSWKSIDHYYVDNINFIVNIIPLQTQFNLISLNVLQILKYILIIFKSKKKI